MGRIIRRTVTITITETVTITWATGDDPLGHPSTVVPEQPKTQGEAEETILPAVTTGAATDAPLDEVAAKPKVGIQRKRTRRRGARDQPST